MSATKPKFPMFEPVHNIPFPGNLRGHDRPGTIQYFKDYYPALTPFFEATLRFEEFYKIFGAQGFQMYIETSGWNSDEDFMPMDAKGRHLDAIRIWGLLKRKVMTPDLLQRMSLWYRWEQSEIRRKERELWEVTPGQEAPWWRRGNPPPDELMDPEVPLLRSDRAKVAASKMCGWHKMLVGHYDRILRRNHRLGPNVE